MSEFFKDSETESSENQEFSLDEYQVTTHDRLRPIEILGISAVVAGFIAFVVGFSTRSWTYLAPITGGIAFVVTLLVVALLMLAIKPSKEDEKAQKFLEERAKLGKHSRHHD